MRTTIELPDPLFRKAKATAALRGSTMKELVVHAIEREVRHQRPNAKEREREVKLPVMIWKGKKKLDLSDFDFDDLVA